MTLRMGTQRESGLAGKSITEAFKDEDGHLILRFTDGTVCKVQGLGYDGLWTDVFVDWLGAAPCSNIECKDGIDQHVNAPCQECSRTATEGPQDG